MAQHTARRLVLQAAEVGSRKLAELTPAFPKKSVLTTSCQTKSDKLIHDVRMTSAAHHSDHQRLTLICCCCCDPLRCDANPASCENRCEDCPVFS